MPKDWRADMADRIAEFESDADRLENDQLARWTKRARTQLKKVRRKVDAFLNPNGRSRVPHSVGQSFIRQQARGEYRVQIYENELKRRGLL